jgi:CRISPR-associated protein Cas1
VTGDWQVLDLSDFSSTVEVRTGRILAGGRQIPVADLAMILTGPGTRWCGDLVALAARHDVVLIACDWRGVPYSATVPWSHATRVGARHRAQSVLSLPRKKNAWMRIVRAKIAGQAANLSSGAPRAAGRLLDLVPRVRSGDPDNLEAQAARIYWGAYLPSERFARDRAGGGVNALLNYGYAILRGMVLRSIVLAGLSPTFGIEHCNRSNPFALADDLIEPFRPAVDWIARDLGSFADLSDRSVKQRLVAVLSTPMAGTGPTIATETRDLAQRFAGLVEGYESRLEVPIWRPADG